MPTQKRPTTSAQKRPMSARTRSKSSTADKVIAPVAIDETKGKRKRREFPQEKNGAGAKIAKASRSRFLLKSEPAEFSIENLRDKEESTAVWDGVRNYEARNIMKSMCVGDECFFYNSSDKVPGIVGIVTVASPATLDTSAIDPKSKYHDPKTKGKEDRCPWVSVQIKLQEIFPCIVTLRELKELKNNDPSHPVADMTILNRSRLSVTRVTEQQWNEVMGLVKRKTQASA